ncbi:MAG: tetratricopeptide repeat protein [Acidimicrobiales bacterium]
MTPDEAVDRATMLLEVGRHEQARDLLLQVGGAPASSRVAFTLGRAHLAGGDYGAAIDAVRTGLAQAPTSDWGHRLLAIVALRQRNRAAAVASATRAVELAPTNPSAHAVLADALQSQGELARAAQHAEEAVRLDPHEASHHVLAGDIALEMGRYPEAKGHLEVALALDPTNARAKNQLGVALDRMGDVEGARRHFAEAAPESETARRNMALLAGAAGTGRSRRVAPGTPVGLPLAPERVTAGSLRVPADRRDRLPPHLCALTGVELPPAWGPDQPDRARVVVAPGVLARRRGAGAAIALVGAVTGALVGQVAGAPAGAILAVALVAAGAHVATPIRRSLRGGATLVRHPSPAYVAAFLTAAGPAVRTPPTDRVPATPGATWVLPPKVRARAKRQALRHLVPAVVAAGLAGCVGLAGVGVARAATPDHTVVGRVVHNSGGVVEVALPDGEVVRVEPDPELSPNADRALVHLDEQPPTASTVTGAYDLRWGVLVVAGFLALLALLLAATGTSHVVVAISQAGGELARRATSLDGAAVRRMPVPYVRDGLLRRIGWRLGVPPGRRPVLFVQGRSAAHAPIRAVDAAALVGASVYLPTGRGRPRLAVTSSGEVVTFRGIAPMLQAARA